MADGALHTRPANTSPCRPSVWEPPPLQLVPLSHCHHTLRKHPCRTPLHKFEGSPNLYLCRNWVPKSVALRRWYIYELRPGGIGTGFHPQKELMLTLSSSHCSFPSRHGTSSARVPTTVMSTPWPKRGLPLDLQSLKQQARQTPSLCKPPR